jgi:hypothetical protein
MASSLRERRIGGILHLGFEFSMEVGRQPNQATSPAKSPIPLVDG